MLAGKQALRIEFPSRGPVRPIPIVKSPWGIPPRASHVSPLCPGRAQEPRKEQRHRAARPDRPHPPEAGRCRIVPSRSRACLRPPPPPRCFRNFRSVREAQKHPRPGRPPICSRRRLAQQIAFAFERRVAPPFAPIALSFRPRRARRIRAAVLFPQALPATLRMLATKGPDSSSQRVSLEKESVSHLVKLRGFAETLPARATKQVFLLRFSAKRSFPEECRRLQVLWLPGPMWQLRRSLLRTIPGPKRCDKSPSSKDSAQSEQTSRSARGHKESFERGKLRQPPAPGDRIARKCAPYQNSAIAPCNTAWPPDSSSAPYTATMSANRWPALHFHCCANRTAIALPRFLALRFAVVSQIPNPLLEHQLYVPFAPIPRIALVLSPGGRRIPGTGRTFL